MTVRLGGVVITNPSKPLWPAEGLTKLDLAQFYARIASQILPWLKGRPLALERCPDGARTTCFYQKHAPANLPDSVPTMPLPGSSAGREANYIIGGTRKTLLTLVNYGCVAMHVMNSRTDHLDRPDWLAFDLDPADGFESVARAGLLLRERLADHGLESFPKTSGGRGLHVFVPLRRGAAQDQVQAYAAAIARELATAYPTVISVEPKKTRRRAPVYIGIMCNASGQTIAPPFAVRWQSLAPVSMPLSWDEVSPRLNPGIFNIRTAERRMARKSPWSRFFGHRQTLPRI